MQVERDRAFALVQSDVTLRQVLQGLQSWAFAVFFSSSTSFFSAAAAAKSLQSCLTLCDLIDGSPPGSPVPGVLQARTLEWVAISFSNAWKWKVKVKSLSHVRLLATPWTTAHQAPPSMGFSRQGYWSGMPLPSPHPFLGHAYSSGTRTLGFPYSVLSRGWTQTGKFTSHIWESAWLPSGHLWPCHKHSGIFGLPALISFHCLWLRLCSLPFPCQWV